MGYRSDVALCLTERGLQTMRDKLSATNAESREKVSKLFESTRIHYADSATHSEMWYWDWLKWYPDYREIAFLEKLMLEIPDDDYLFIRIGESTDDAEISGAYYDNPFGLYLTRSIEFNET